MTLMHVILLLPLATADIFSLLYSRNLICCSNLSIHFLLGTLVIVHTMDLYTVYTCLHFSVVWTFLHSNSVCIHVLSMCTLVMHACVFLHFNILCTFLHLTSYILFAQLTLQLFWCIPALSCAYCGMPAFQ